MARLSTTYLSLRGYPAPAVRVASFQCHFSLNGCANLGKCRFEWAIRIAGGRLYRNKLVLCSGLIFGLIGGWPCDRLLRITECVGVAPTMHTPLPAFAAE